VVEREGLNVHLSGSFGYRDDRKLCSLKGTINLTDGRKVRMIVKDFGTLVNGGLILRGAKFWDPV
jgi:hypothetical protein